MKNTFICPICKNSLEGEKALKCINGHCYDRAKSGYVNLLSGRGGNHGDPKEMVISRREFLDKGYYEPLARSICSSALKYIENGSLILDAGLGEGYYTKMLADTLKAAGKAVGFAGIDVSKDAVNYASKRFPKAELAVASVYAIPMADSSVDTVISIFAPCAREEFLRVLKPEGVFIMVIGGTEHLWSLKCAVYDEPYKNEPCEYGIEGFEILEKIGCRYDFTLESNTDIKNLFAMTPYYHKTSPRDIEKLDKLDSLRTEADFEILIYKRK